MDQALVDQNLSFRAFRSARDRFLAERAAEAALVRSARRAHEWRLGPSSDHRRIARPPEPGDIPNPGT